MYRPDGRKVVILDWKTGDDSDVELQIPVYALYCRTVLGLPFRDEEWFGRVVNLATGEDRTYEISRLDVMGAAQRVRDSVSIMQSLLADPDLNVPHTIEEFPITEPERGSVCRYCPFLELCESELAARGLAA